MHKWYLYLMLMGSQDVIIKVTLPSEGQLHACRVLKTKTRQLWLLNYFLLVSLQLYLLKTSS